MKTLTHSSFQAKHWQELAAQLGIAPPAHGEDVALPLNVLLTCGLSETTQAVERIGSAALREFRIKACFQKMRGAWRALRMEVQTLGNPGSGRKMLKGFDAVRALIEEHQASVQSLLTSQLVGGVEVQAREWLRKLSELECLCGLLEACQILWIYLVPIFDYQEMQQSLKIESQLFTSASKVWMDEIICRLDENACLLDLAELEELPQRLRSACDELNLIVKGLNDYLDQKRLVFPRFFFLSNEELVQLLAGASQPRTLGRHLQKCFEGIESLKFTDDERQAVAIYSHRKERIPFLAKVMLHEYEGRSSIEDLFSTVKPWHWALRYCSDESCV